MQISNVKIVLVSTTVMPKMRLRHAMVTIMMAIGCGWNFPVAVDQEVIAAIVVMIVAVAKDVAIAVR